MLFINLLILAKIFKNEEIDPSDIIELFIQKGPFSMENFIEKGKEKFGLKLRE